MADLDEQIRSSGDVPVVDPSRRIEEPGPDEPKGPTSRARAGVILVAFAVALTSFAGAPLAFRHGPAPSSGTEPSPSGSGAVSNGEIYVSVPAEGSTEWDAVRPDGSDQQVVISPNAPINYVDIAWAPGGARIAFRVTIGGLEGIYTANPNGSDPIRLTDGVNDSWPSWSPDGSKIVFSSTRAEPSVKRCAPTSPEFDGACPLDLYEMEADGSNVVRLTDDPQPEAQPSWSPDGTQISFVGLPYLPDLLEGIFVMNANGSDVRKVAVTPEGSNFSPSWSPDGRRLTYLSMRGEEWWVFVVNADGSDERSIAGASFADDPGALALVEDVAWSPDGMWIAFTGMLGSYEPAGGASLYLLRPDGSGLHAIGSQPQTGLVEVAWRPAGASSSSSGASVARVIDVGVHGSVSGMTFGFGSLWVDGYEGSTGPGHVIRFEPVTGERIADISIGPVAPGWLVGGGGITVGDGAVWVTGTVQVPDGSGVDTDLVRIDPATNQVVDAIGLGGKVATDVAVDANGVWVLFGGDDDTMRIARIDPSTDRVAATILLPQAYGHFLFSVDGSIVAFTNETHPELGKTVVDIVDPTTETLARSATLAQHLLWPAAGDGSVWLVDGTSIETIDPHAGEVTGSWQLESTGDALAVGSGGVWFLDPQERSPSRWNASLQAVDLSVVLDAGLTPNVITTSPGSVWVLTFEGQVVEIDVG